MGKIRQTFTKLFKFEPETVDPQAVALDATLTELRQVSSELRSTTEQLKGVVGVLTERQK